MYGEQQVFNITCSCYFATGNSKFNMHKRELLFQEGNLKYKRFLVQTRRRHIGLVTFLPLMAPKLQLIKLFLIIQV
jgi:hypothetical protein